MKKNLGILILSVLILSGCKSETLNENQNTSSETTFIVTSESRTENTSASVPPESAAETGTSVTTGTVFTETVVSETTAETTVPAADIQVSENPDIEFDLSQDDSEAENQINPDTDYNGEAIELPLIEF